jgi:hypothetical protein
MTMKAILKNPNLYYILAPVLAAVWALLAGVVFYPGSVKAYEEDAKSEYEQSQEWIEKILTVQPQRLQYSIENGSDRPFDFGDVITTLTQAFDISTSRYTLNVRGEVNRAGKRARTATVDIKEINVEKAARFLATMLSAWPDLKCEVLSLEKAKTGKDNWNVDMTLTYYY